MKNWIWLTCAGVCSIALAKPQQTPFALDKIKLPQGFEISIFAEAPGARSLAMGKDEVLFVGTRGEGKVYAIKDGVIHVIASGLNAPNGVAYANGDLFVAEVSRVLRFKNIDATYAKNPKPEALSAKFPDEDSHGWKYLRVGPDGKLYIPVGAPCNVCDIQDPFSRIFRMNLDGSKLELVAQGVRNTVGYDWHPKTRQLWFTDNGRDWLGDDVPPDELNVVTKVGEHFGFPHCHGNNIVDPKFNKGKPCSSFVAPVVELQAHTAALGMRFYSGNAFPQKYRNQIFIAEHGSWNRSSPAGYRIMNVFLNENGKHTYEVFAEGWLQGNTRNSVLGRPVDILVHPDGSLLVSDDSNGLIYRISYAKK